MSMVGRYARARPRPKSGDRTRSARPYDCAVEAHLELAYDGAIVAVPLWAGRLTLGRADSNNLPIKDDAVSRVHASVERIAGQYVLRDLGSSNGTLVNGERIIADRTLHPDDEITSGIRESSFAARRSIWRRPLEPRSAQPWG